jgi:hypothetical protein
MKNGCKVFTKNNEKGIIRKKYNFFTANNKKYLQRKGLLMKETKEITLNGVTKELNWKEKIIIRIFNKTFNKVSNLVRVNIVNQMIK